MTPDKAEPVYEAIKEETKPTRPSSIGLADDLTASAAGDGGDGEFVTPTTSPLFARKSPDAVSTASSNGDGDLMKEILKEVTVGKEDDALYSTLTRKKNKDKKKL